MGGLTRNKLTIAGFVILSWGVWWRWCKNEGYPGENFSQLHMCSLCHTELGSSVQIVRMLIRDKTTLHVQLLSDCAFDNVCWEVKCV